MSRRPDYRLPDGTATRDADKMVEAWNELSAPFTSLGYVRYGFDPGITVFKPGPAGQSGRMLSMTVEQARELGAVIRERDELRQALSIPEPRMAAPDGVIAGTTEWTKEGIPLPAPPAEAQDR